MLDTIPAFPKTDPLSFHQRDDVNKFNAIYGGYSGFWFSNLFLMDLDNKTRLSQLNEHLLIGQENTNGEMEWSVLGPDIVAVVDLLNIRGIDKFGLLPYPTPGSKPDADNADYVYSVKEMVALAGKKYQGVRRKINQFSGLGEIELRSYQPEDERSVWCLCDYLNEKQINDTGIAISASLEMEALEKSFVFWEQLGLNIHVLTVKDEIVGFSVTEVVSAESIQNLSKQSLLIHFYKSDHSLPGAAEYMFYILVKKHHGKVETVNFQQDLGITGLRRFKNSLRPINQNLIFCNNPTT